MCMISEIAGPGDHFNLLQAAEMMGVAPKAAERFAFACRAASAIGVSGLDHSSTRPPTRAPVVVAGGQGHPPHGSSTRVRGATPQTGSDLTRRLPSFPPPSRARRKATSLRGGGGRRRALAAHAFLSSFREVMVGTHPRGA